MNEDQFQEKNTLTKMSFVDMIAEKRGMTPKEFLKTGQVDSEDQHANPTLPGVIEAESEPLAHVGVIKLGTEQQPNIYPLKPKHVVSLYTDILRSPVFRILGRGKRQVYYTRTQVYVYGEGKSGVKISMQGIALDQGDSGVIQAILSLYNGVNPIRTSYNELLRILGKAPGGSANKWLKASLDRLRGTAVIVESTYLKKDCNSGFLKMWAQDLVTGDLVIEIFEPFFKGEDHKTWLNLLVRKDIDGQLAQKLYEFVSTHLSTKEHPTKIGLDKLIAICGSSYKQARDFKQEVKSAMEQLKNKCLIDNYWFEANVLCFVRSTAIRDFQSIAYTPDIVR